MVISQFPWENFNLFAIDLVCGHYIIGELDSLVEALVKCLGHLNIHILNSGILSWPTPSLKKPFWPVFYPAKKTDMLAGAVCLVLFHCSGGFKKK